MSRSRSAGSQSDRNKQQNSKQAKIWSTVVFFVIAIAFAVRLF